MANKSALPLLVAAGAAAVLLSKKKKKNTSSGSSDTGTYDDLDLPPIADTSEPPPEKDSKRPAGDPPGGDSYDADYWGSNTLERMTKIRQHFADLGYGIEVGPWPMNHIGPKGTMEVENQDGTMGRLGGNDDKSSPIVRQFQNDYNAVSRCKEVSGLVGGLAPDGLVGYFTLNGLRTAHESLGAKSWQDILRTCATKGFQP